MKTTLRILLLALTLTGPLARAADDPAKDAPREFPVRIVERTLGNGLKVLVVPRAGATVAPCAIAYRVGSVNEPAGQTGMAHYLEHMMFKGTRKTGVKDLALDARLRAALDRVVAETLRLEDGPRSPEADARLAALRAERDRLIEEQKRNLEINHLFTIYREAGSTFTNAMTNQDATMYVCAVPPEKVELFFWVESDRLRNIVFRQFHAEKDVVREERRMYENRPGAFFDEAVERALFGSHPYAHGVLGSHVDLRALTRTELRTFWSAYYSPDNAVILVGGDVDPERVFALAERYFGFLPASTAVRPRVPALRTSGGGELRMEGRGPGQDSVEVLHRVPAAGTDAALPLTLLADHLRDSERALVRDLVDRQKLALSVRARYDGMKYGGVFSVSARLAPGADRAATEIRIVAALDELGAELPPERMEDLRRRYRARVLGAVRRDMRIGFTILRREMTGSWRDIERDLVRVRAISARELQDVARAYLVRDNRLVAHYEGGAPAPSAEAPAAPGATSAGTDVAPRAGVPESWTDLVYEERPFVLPSAADARRELPNGMRVFVVPVEGEPVVRAAAHVLGGSVEDPPGKEGLTEICAAMLEEAGIPGLEPVALRERLEAMVGSVSASAGEDEHVVSVTVFPADMDEGLRILRGLLAAPALDPEAFARIRAVRIARAEAEEERLGAVAARTLDRLMRGDAARTPTAESLGAITLGDVRSRIAAITGPSRIVLAVSGDLDRDEVAARLERAFEDWAPGGIAPPAAPPTPGTPGLAVLHSEQMKTSQGAVRIAVPTVPATHEDAPALRVLAAVLSRRVFDQIRSVHGLSYQAGARFERAWRHDGAFTVAFQTKCPSVAFAVRLAREEIARMIAEGPTGEEVADAVRGLDARYRRMIGARAADAFAEALAGGVDPSFHARRRAQIAAVTADRVREVAARWLAEERLRTLVVGDLPTIAAGDGVHPDRLRGVLPATAGPDSDVPPPPHDPITPPPPDEEGK